MFCIRMRFPLMFHQKTGLLYFFTEESRRVWPKLGFCNSVKPTDVHRGGTPFQIKATQKLGESVDPETSSTSFFEVRPYTYTIRLDFEIFKLLPSPTQVLRSTRGYSPTGTADVSETILRLVLRALCPLYNGTMHKVLRFQY